MARKTRRPATRSVGPIKLRAIRGPHKEHATRWYWRAEVYEAGASRTVWTGWADPDDAARTAAEILSRGMLDTPKNAAALTTVKDLLECFIAAQEARADLRPATVRVRRFAARRLIGAIGEVRLSRVGLSTVEDYRDQRAREGYAGRTIVLDVEVLRTAWAWGRPRGAVDGEPPPRVRVKVVPKVTRYTPTPGEVAAVLAQLKTLGPRKGLAREIRPGWPWLMLLLHFATGARLSEVGGLRVGDVDLAAGVIRVSGKTGPRDVPLLDPAIVAELRGWTEGRHPTAMLLTVSARGSKQIQKYLNAACEAAEVPRFTTHALRRLVADTLARSGVDVATAAAILGHSPMVMLTVYRTVSAEDRRAGALRAGLGKLPRGVVIDLVGEQAR